MDKTPVNPWSWQDQFGFSQAWRVDGAQSAMFASGQVAMSAEGQVVGEGDFETQARQAFENLQTVLQQAGASLDAVVKLTVYLTDITKLRDYTRIKAEFMTGNPPASTAIGVAALALPQLMIEIEAIALL
ncbi:MAG: RidA family protein [Actinobacteria bacterium]|nr:MAG: RidA family protein [Actinomycetota bacterium]